VKFSLRRLTDILRGLITERGKKMRLIVPRLKDILRGLVTKRGRTMRLIVAILAVVLLCIMLSGLMLIQVTSDYQPSQTNQPSQPSGTNESTEPNQVTPDAPQNKPISNVGSLKTIDIGAYWDENLTNRVNQINWGLLEPGDQKSFSIYLHNEGNSAVTLIRSTSNWSPSAAATYLTLKWDYNGQTIEAGKNLKVTLTLSVNTDITGITNFSFDITVVGTG
jgi:hypothetical protein